jgi:hypothetical protein
MRFFRDDSVLMIGGFLALQSGGAPAQPVSEDGRTTVARVLVSGEKPGLGSFSRGRESVDLTTSVQAILGPVAGAGFRGEWTGWRAVDPAALATGAESSTQPVVGLVFARGTAAELPLLRTAIGELQAGGGIAVVLPSEPDLRIADVFRLRQESVMAGAEFVDLGSLAGGNPFDAALGEALKAVRERRRGPAHSTTEQAGRMPAPSQDVPGRRSASQGPDARPVGPVTTEMQGDERVIYMAPPPAIRDIPRQRPVPRDPTLKKVPALSN